ncbi:MAG TPA: ROK family protein [Saprospiraceae bacterium]|nr:ROK family protein [Saprospiraceae bacterium]HMQ84073.1 ROK family protein [Saprospiraceae bacterium]
MNTKNIAIGADVGGSHITCTAVDLISGQLLSATETRTAIAHEEPAEVLFQAWADALNTCYSHIDPRHFAGWGFAIPGPFDYKMGISHMQHKFRAIYGMHIPTHLKPLLQPAEDLPIRFLNDASAFAVGEAWVGEGRGMHRVIVITLGTGFGAAYVENGIPIVERQDVAPEGCFWHLPYKEGIADEYFSTGWFTRNYELKTGSTLDNVKNLVDDPQKKAIADSLFREFAHNLAEFLTPWLRLFPADMLVIGGNISKALPRFQSELVQNLHEAGIRLRIAPSRLMETSATLGSARLLDEPFWEQVSQHLPNI